MGSGSDGVVVRPLEASDESAALQLLERVLGPRLRLRRPKGHEARRLPGFGAWDGGELVGVAIRRGAELSALAVAPGHRAAGTGSALLRVVIDDAAAAGEPELWLVTTNDNVTALRLYQRHGFRFDEIRKGAVDRQRRYRPSIPLIGQHGIEMRDELVLRRPL